MKQILTIAHTEIRLGIRNNWILLSSAILTVFSVLLVLLGSAPAGEVDAHLLSVTVASLSTLAVYLIPLIALLLSFDAIAGELDRGTLQLVLAMPIARWQVLAGKYLGHLAVLTIALVTGYGIAGMLALFIGGAVGTAAVAGLAVLVLTSVLLGAVFIAIGYLASACVRQTGTAAALAVAIWLVAVVFYDMALLGGLLASQDGVFAREIFPWLLLANPADAFRVFNISAIDAETIQTGLGSSLDGLPLNGTAALLSPAAWVLAALLLTGWKLRRLEP